MPMPSTHRYLLVDGHSVIFSWPELRALHQRDRSRARLQLQKQLQALHDTTSWGITLVYDGTIGTQPERGPKDMVVLYSQAHQTADSIIERLVGQVENRAQITVVTADEAEKRTVEAMGALTASPEWLSSELNTQQFEWQKTIRNIGKREQW